MTIFHFPFNVTPEKPYIKNKKTIIESSGIKDFLTDEQIDKAEKIITLSKEGFLTWVKGYEDNSTVSYKNSFTIIDSKVDFIESENILVDLGCREYSWDFNTMTSGYRFNKGQCSLDITLGEKVNELELLDLVVGLSYTYGQKFDIHTIDESERKYSITIEGSDQENVVVFMNDLDKRLKKEKIKGLSFSVKYHTKGDKPYIEREIEPMWN